MVMVVDLSYSLWKEKFGENKLSTVSLLSGIGERRTQNRNIKGVLESQFCFAFPEKGKMDP